eukprot:3567601-Rhodomonas_salina.3
MHAKGCKDGEGVLGLRRGARTVKGCKVCEGVQGQRRGAGAAKGCEDSEGVQGLPAARVTDVCHRAVPP